MGGKYEERGFSLLEVGLALSIGVIIMGATLYAYQALKDQSGDAAMRQKIHDLQSLVEELYAPANMLPTADNLRLAWQKRRPADYDQNPWGGPVMGGGQVLGLSITPLGHGGTVGSGMDGNLFGGLYYYPINPAPTGLPGTAHLWDIARGQSVPVTLYGVAGNKKQQRHFGVVSGR